MKSERVDPWKRREEGIARAQEFRFSKEDIGKAIGTDGSNLANLIRRKAPRSRFVPALDQWLDENVWSRDALDKPVTLTRIESQEERQEKNREMLQGVLRKDPATIVAAKLYAAADTLMSPDFDDDAKLIDLMDTIEYLFKNRDSIRSAFNKAGKGVK